MQIAPEHTHCLSKQTSRVLRDDSWALEVVLGPRHRSVMAAANMCLHHSAAQHTCPGLCSTYVNRLADTQIAELTMHEARPETTVHL